MMMDRSMPAPTRSRNRALKAFKLRHPRSKGVADVQHGEMAPICGARTPCRFGINYPGLGRPCRWLGGNDANHLLWHD
jgi:hypothetical protein